MIWVAYQLILHAGKKKKQEPGSSSVPKDWVSWEVPFRHKSRGGVLENLWSTICVGNLKKLGCNTKDKISSSLPARVKANKWKAKFLPPWAFIWSTTRKCHRIVLGLPTSSNLIKKIFHMSTRCSMPTSFYI